MTDSNRKWLWALAALVILLIVGRAMGPTGSDEPDSAQRQGRASMDAVDRNTSMTVTERSPVEAKRVVIDDGTKSVSRAKVDRFAGYLNQLNTHCQESRDRIADMALATRKILVDQGKAISVEATLRDLSVMMNETGLSDQKCAETFA